MPFICALQWVLIQSAVLTQLMDLWCRSGHRRRAAPSAGRSAAAPAATRRTTWSPSPTSCQRAQTKHRRAPLLSTLAAGQSDNQTTLCVCAQARESAVWNTTFHPQCVVISNDDDSNHDDLFDYNNIKIYNLCLLYDYNCYIAKASFKNFNDYYDDRRIITMIFMTILCAYLFLIYYFNNKSIRNNKLMTTMIILMIFHLFICSNHNIMMVNSQFFNILCLKSAEN